MGFFELRIFLLKSHAYILFGGTIVFDFGRSGIADIFASAVKSGWRQFVMTDNFRSGLAAFIKGNHLPFKFFRGFTACAVWSGHDNSYLSIDYIVS